MINTVFISDLHLHPEETEIQARFNAFIEWTKTSVKKIYILGDFFHAWAGDDAIDAWSLGIAKQLYELKSYGIEVFYMHGNRDFLLGKRFAQHAGWEVLSEPAFVQLGSERIMLVHGDSYCTKDISHQRFRRLTRNKLFTSLFLSLPLGWRDRLVNTVRQRSTMNYNKPPEQMDVVAKAVINHMKTHQINLLIHGHTHRFGITNYEIDGLKLKRYVLSDWDDNPHLLCYDNTKGLHFIRM